jgi:hypothetical protein
MNVFVIASLLCIFAFGWSWNNKPARHDSDENEVPEKSAQKRGPKT